jgi:hypothetical protein
MMKIWAFVLRNYILYSSLGLKSIYICVDVVLLNTDELAIKYRILFLLGYGLDDRGFESRKGLGIFLFTKNMWSYTSIPPIRLHGVVLS